MRVAPVDSNARRRTRAPASHLHHPLHHDCTQRALERAVHAFRQLNHVGRTPPDQPIRAPGRHVHRFLRTGDRPTQLPGHRTCERPARRRASRAPPARLDQLGGRTRALQRPPRVPRVRPRQRAASLRRLAKDTRTPRFSLDGSKVRMKSANLATGYRKVC